MSSPFQSIQVQHLRETEIQRHSASGNTLMTLVGRGKTELIEARKRIEIAFSKRGMVEGMNQTVLIANIGQPSP